MKKIIVSVGILVFSNIIFAQGNMSQQVSFEMKKLILRYKSAGMLSFDIRYRYSAENKPGEILDSVSGSFKIRKDKYWYNLAGTEAVGDSNLAVVLFKEDNIMYLSKPSGATRSTANPFSLLDSMIASKKVAEATVSSNDRYTKIILIYSPGLSYKSVEYDIDPKTGYLIKMISVVEARQFYDPSVKNKVMKGTYALVEEDFINYSEKFSDQQIFDQSRYFKKTGNEYETVSPYQSYKIFLGTPNL